MDNNGLNLKYYKYGNKPKKNIQDIIHDIVGL
jgi:hypothetical protein